MPRNSSQTSEEKSTLLALQPGSCQRCWNQPVNPEYESADLKRLYGIYSCIPVYLVEPDGNIVLLCHKAQCLECGDIKRYYLRGRGEVAGVFKKGALPDFSVEYWPEIRRHGLDAQGFVDAVLAHPNERYFYVGQLPKYDSGRHQPDFYEPNSERREVPEW